MQQCFCQKGITGTIHKTYQSAFRKFASFCSKCSTLSSFPVSESPYVTWHLFLHASSFPLKQLSPQTTKTYLADVRHVQVALGLLEPKQLSSLPCLKLVQSGIQHAHRERCQGNIRLPITPEILLKIQIH